MEKTFKYNDILNLKRPASTRARMTKKDRAAQFMPFAALTGFGAVINETSRETSEKHALSEEELALLNENLNRIKDKVSDKPKVKVLFFIPDKRKKGGKYETYSGNVRRLDEFEKELVFTDKSKIKIEDIMLLEII